MLNAIQLFGGATQLAFDFAGGILRAVEQMHANIARPSRSANASPHATGTITEQVYTVLRGTHGMMADAVSHGVRSLTTSSALSADTGRDGILPIAVVNGICGDHLEATQNPLAIPLSLRTLTGPVEWTPKGVAAAYAHVSPHITVWVHGLCLSEQQWLRAPHEPMGVRLHEDLEITPVYVRYNSGRHISTNGRELSDHLERMIEAWPVPVETLTLIGHSMGGLVVRSAGWYGERDARNWRDKLSAVVCLGTPHHGTPLEKGGELVTRLMQASPYSSPLAFGRGRSAGIKDLRHGNLLDEDWQHADADDSRNDRRTPVPLLAEVDYYFAAAIIGRSPHGPLGRILGDLLVRTDSAIGAHRDSGKHVAIPSENCRVFPNMNHFDLLGHPQVYEQLLQWLARDPASSHKT